MGETLGLEQKIRRFEFLILWGYQLQTVADAKRRRSNFIMYLKGSFFYVLIRYPLFNLRFAMSDFYPTWLYFSDLKLKQPSKFTKKI